MLLANPADGEVNGPFGMLMRYLRHNRWARIAAVLGTVCLLSNGPSLAAKSRVPSDQHYKQAIELLAKGDHKGGIAELKTALEDDPKDLAARVLLGNIYLEIKDGVSAAEHFLQARKDGAGDSFILAPLARAYVLQGRHEDALKELDSGQKLPSIAAEIALIRADAHFALKHFLDAEKNYLAALKIRPKNSRTLNGLARVKIATKDLSGAANYVERALEAKPTDARAWYAKGEISRLRRKEDEALSHYGRSIELAPHYVPPRLARARIVIGHGAYRDAEPDIIAIRDVEPRNPHATFLEALILADEDRVREARAALAELETLLEDKPAADMSDPPTVFLQGVVAYFRKDYANAYRHLTAYLKHAPKDVDTLKLLASLALSSGDSDYALHLLEQLAPREPDDIEVLAMYGDALLRARRLHEAVKVLEKAVAIANPETTALSRLVMLTATAGQNTEARKMLKAEVARDPKAVQAALLLSAVQLNHRDYALSFESAASVIERDSRNPVAHNLAGGALLGLNDIEGARSSFRAAFEAAPKYVLAVSNLAKLEFRLGNLSAAERLYTYMVEQDSRDGGAMMALADIDLMRDDMDSALSWLERAREHSRAPGRAALRLVDFHIYADQYDRALAVARDLVSQEPANLAYLTALGRARLAANRAALAVITFKEVAVRAGEKKSVDWLVRNVAWQMRAFDEEGAREALQKALELDDKNLSAHVEFFRLEMAAERFDAAIERAGRIVALNRNSPLGDTLRGDAYMRQRKFESALQAYTNALKKSRRFAELSRVYRARRAAGDGALQFAVGWAEKHPEDRGAQRLLAIAYGDAGRGSDAAAVYEKLLETSPRDTQLLVGLALESQKQDASRALEVAERAFKAAPAEPAVMDTYGWILVQQGRLDEGLTLLRKAKLRAPDRPEISYHMAVALNKLGKPEDAQRELNAALQTGRSFDGAGDARQLLSQIVPTQQ